MTFAQRNYLIAACALGLGGVLWWSQTPSPPDLEETLATVELSENTPQPTGSATPAAEILPPNTPARVNLPPAKADARQVIRPDGSFDPAAITVAVPTPSGENMMLRGDDPRAQAYLAEAARIQAQPSTYDRDADRLDLTGVTPDNSLVRGGRKFRLKDAPPEPATAPSGAEARP